MPEPVHHKITVWAIGFSDSVPISEAEFDAIRAAKQRLMFGVGIEEKIDLVLENYAELERSLIDMALEHSIFPGKINALLDGGTHLVNRRIANFLTTARLYLDQLAHDLSKIHGKASDTYKNFKKSTNVEYDSVLGYRVMEELRNHVQHRSLPTHGISFPMTRDESTDPAQLRFGVVPSVDVAELADDPDFKNAVLKQLAACADKNGFCNLIPFIREYAESLGRIHEQVRSGARDELTAADALLQEYRAKAQEKFGGSSAGLVAVACDEQGLHKDREHMSDRPISRRRDLEKKNRHLDGLSRRYVSSAS